MQIIKRATLTIAPNRQRREFKLDELNELRESIAKHSLFHPVVIRTGDDGLPILVAGERRLRAIDDLRELGGELRCAGQLVAPDELPVVHLGELSPLLAEEAELEENIRRTDLTWQERASATSRLASLRLAQASAAGLPPPTVANLSLEVRGVEEGRGYNATRKELIVAKHLDKPEVRAAKTVEEAFKVLKRVEDTQKRVELAASVGKTFGPDAHRAIQGDSQTILSTWADNSFDVILTDPPYGMGADEFGDSGGKAAGAHGYADDKDILFRILQWAPHTLFRVAKPQAHIYWFCDIDHFHLIRKAFATAGWECFRTPLIWHKVHGMRAPWPDGGPHRKYEIALYARKGKRPVTKLYPDLVAYAADPNLGHSAQKPVALFEDFLRRSVSPGDTVLDCFAGSGPIFPAAHKAQCSAVGIEMLPENYALCVGRIEALRAQGELAL